MFATPYEALDALLTRLQPVASETVSWRDAAGRVLAQSLTADRDSPPCDCSSMDGYALRLGDICVEGVTVAGEVSIGRRPPELPPGRALRIVTGAPLPAGAEAVIRREDVEEQPSRIVLREGVQVEPGQNIRRQGENITGQQTVLDRGRLLDAAAMAAVATFGVAQLHVYRRVRVAVIVTGDELRSTETPVAAWELRDANGPALQALLAAVPWLEPLRVLHAGDHPAAIEAALEKSLADCDAVLLTGGASMGQHDFVPDAIAQVGGEFVFRKLPIRPGRPMLAAVAPGGQAILGLPGNPVSVLVTARRFAAAALGRLSGISDADLPCGNVALVNPDADESPLWRYRPVRLVACGRAELVKTMGSGDVVSTAASDGFVEIPPGRQGCGPWPFWRWTL